MSPRINHPHQSVIASLFVEVIVVDTPYFRAIFCGQRTKHGQDFLTTGGGLLLNSQFV